MSRRIPSIKAILSFEAAAKHENFSIAAEELNITPGAISKQIINLEEELSVLLFQRHSKGVSLTKTGKDYFKYINKSLNEIEDQTNKIRDLDKSDNEIVINIAPSFSDWLIDRICDFQKQCPEFKITIVNKGCGNLQSANADISIYASKKEPKDLCAHFLYEEKLRLICHPDVKINKISDVIEHEFLEHQSREGTLNGFCKEFGLKNQDLRINSRIGHFSNMINMAKRNNGIALVPDVIVEEELKNKTLINPLNISYMSQYSYYLAYEKHKYYSLKMSKFRKYFF